MTVAELIRELQAMPQHQQVHVFVPGLWESGQFIQAHEACDTAVADKVEPCGTYVVVKGY